MCQADCMCPAYRQIRLLGAAYINSWENVQEIKEHLFEIIEAENTGTFGANETQKFTLCFLLDARGYLYGHEVKRLQKAINEKLKPKIIKNAAMTMAALGIPARDDIYINTPV